MTPEGGWPIAALRALSDASLLSMMGALVFRACVGPAGVGIARLSAAAACVALPAWVAAQAVNLGGSLGATVDILSITEFGHRAAESWVCALIVLFVAGPRWRLLAALAAAFAAVVLQAAHSHAAAMEPGLSLLRVSVTVHLLAAGAWLGGLLPLGRLVAAAPLPEVVAAVRRFSALGIGCVLLLAATAWWQASILVGGLAGWAGTEYGHVAIAKAVLFAGLVGFAAVNRQWLSPRLVGAQPDRGRRMLTASVGAEIVTGLAVVAAAALLSSLEPAMHQQPLWPFSVQPSLVSVNEDADIRQEVVLAGSALATAVGLLIATLGLRRFRVVALALTAVVGTLAWPHLAVLFVPAYPTSYFQSPSGFAASSIMRGAALYPSHCSACHGATGQGNGPLAANLPVPPADLTAPHLWMHSDGELFWWLSHGIEAPDGRPAMPGFQPVLGDDDLWALIDYVRASNAGLVRHAEGDWSPPLHAPDLTATCADGRQVTMPDLHGQVVRVLFPGPVPAPMLPDAEAVTIAAAESGGSCRAADPAVRAAYALILGRPAASLPGTTVLIDPNGWLRADDASGLDAQALTALVRRIRANPLAATAGGHVHAE